jgi:hypothetical protein
MSRFVVRLRQAVGKAPGARRAVRLFRALFSPHRRAIRRVERDRPGALLQPSSTTRLDRYPALFGFVRDRLAHLPEPRILSYGCATGEEVFTLRDYFPRAWITGVDINPRSISRARRRLASRPDARIDFRLCGSPAELGPAEYDAVFCMAVLRHGDLLAEKPDLCDRLLPFARAEAIATSLADRLGPGGYLALWCVQFRFTDMAVSDEFEIVLSDDSGGYFNQPLYGPDNRRCPGAACLDAIFRKRSGPQSPAVLPRHA